MNNDDLEYIKEIKSGNLSTYNFDDENFGKIKILIIYRGEGLFFQLNDKALICDISAREAKLSIKSIVRWDDGKKISPKDKETLIHLIKLYYYQAYKDKLS